MSLHYLALLAAFWYALFATDCSPTRSHSEFEYQRDLFELLDLTHHNLYTSRDTAKTKTRAQRKQYESKTKSSSSQGPSISYRKTYLENPTRTESSPKMCIQHWIQYVCGHNKFVEDENCLGHHPTDHRCYGIGWRIQIHRPKPDRLCEECRKTPQQRWRRRPSQCNGGPENGHGAAEA
ncbi:hypothetical protein M430DRAFT_45285 [Amorphotheca resinae ATCC 22711]|uniref:Secreted protein n=1 Tax=Amorphotheca resinae ATCC 22711 TaxID=857342 RepID=A0A2T3AS61_AMORE|nr:hypothetical protein M430DRAFT_45285 [Amorphotheca resinae ATCC 22711]PSS09183.1 hypothetical protein M430DRAFT_45285 [Amorphotheca resinae ATCC 22711]